MRIRCCVNETTILDGLTSTRSLTLRNSICISTIAISFLEKRSNALFISTNYLQTRTHTHTFTHARIRRYTSSRLEQKIDPSVVYYAERRIRLPDPPRITVYDSSRYLFMYTRADCLAIGRSMARCVWTRRSICMRIKIRENPIPSPRSNIPKEHPFSIGWFPKNIHSLARLSANRSRNYGIRKHRGGGNDEIDIAAGRKGRNSAERIGESSKDRASSCKRFWFFRRFRRKSIHLASSKVSKKQYLHYPASVALQTPRNSIDPPESSLLRKRVSHRGSSIVFDARTRERIRGATSVLPIGKSAVFRCRSTTTIGIVFAMTIPRSNDHNVSSET